MTDVGKFMGKSYGNPTSAKPVEEKEKESMSAEDYLKNGGYFNLEEDMNTTYEVSYREVCKLMEQYKNQ